MISFYCIIKKSRFTLRPWHNWIVGVERRRTGVRCGWLWFDITIAAYDRDAHLKSLWKNHSTFTSA